MKSGYVTSGRPGLRGLAIFWFTLLASISASAAGVGYEYDEFGRLKRATYDYGTAPGSNAGALAFSTGAYSGSEGVGAVTVTVIRTGGSTGAAAVSYATSNGTASAGSDYSASSGTLNWADGDGTSKVFNVSVTQDALAEADETVNLSLSSPTGGATLGGQSTAVLTILNDDVAPTGTLQLTAGTYTIAENGGSLVVTASRINGAYGAASINYGTANGTATAGSDYTAVSGTLNWAANDSANKTFSIPILTDVPMEGSETFTVNLSGASGATAGTPTSATVTITDVDVTAPGAPGTPSLSSITGTTATASWGAASDNFGVTAYRYRLNGGTWNTLGNVTTVNLSSLTANTAYTIEVQARDAAEFWSSSASNTFTTTLITDNLAYFGGGTVGSEGQETYGYINSSLGSLTPNTTSNSKSIGAFYSYYDPTTGDLYTILDVYGFSSNPGTGWLSSISLSGAFSLTGASASFVYPLSGWGRWVWWGVAYPGYGSSTLTIVHK